MYRVLFTVTEAYFKLKPLMNKLERIASGMRNRSTFHRNYGKGDKCVIVNCKCKGE